MWNACWMVSDTARWVPPEWRVSAAASTHTNRCSLRGEREEGSTRQTAIVPFWRKSDRRWSGTFQRSSWNIFVFFRFADFPETVLASGSSSLGPLTRLYRHYIWFMEEWKRKNVLALFDCFHYLLWFVLIVAFSRHSPQLGQDSLVSVWMISTLRILQFFLGYLWVCVWVFIHFYCLCLAFVVLLAGFLRSSISTHRWSQLVSPRLVLLQGMMD